MGFVSVMLLCSACIVCGEQAVPVTERDAWATELAPLELRGLDLAKMAASQKILDKLYQVTDIKAMSAAGRNVRIAKRVLRQPRYASSDKVPEALYVLEGDDKRTLIEGHLFSDNKIECHITGVEPSTLVLVIEDYAGGNAANGNLSLMVSLEKDFFLRFLGRAAVEESGRLCMTEDVWEKQLLYFCHAECPYATIYLTVRDNQIVPDAAKNRAYCRERIRLLDVELRSMPRNGDDSEDTADRKFLITALVKLLHYRIMGKHDQGLKELQKDIDARADSKGCLGISSLPSTYWTPPVPIEKVSVTEILSTVKAFFNEEPVVTLPPVTQAVHLVR